MITPKGECCLCHLESLPDEEYCKYCKEAVELDYLEQSMEIWAEVEANED